MKKTGCSLANGVLTFRPNCYALFYYARLSLYVLLEGSLTLYPIILQNRGS